MRFRPALAQKPGCLSAVGVPYNYDYRACVTCVNPRLRDADIYVRVESQVDTFWFRAYIHRVRNKEDHTVVTVTVRESNAALVAARTGGRVVGPAWTDPRSGERLVLVVREPVDDDRDLGDAQRQGALA
jgi:hypothetical protein